MSGLHERFGAWLADGAPGDPPRDAALHASGCETCLRRAAALDALSTIDLGLAPMPPVRVAGRPASSSVLPVARAAAGVTAVVLLAVATGVLAGSWFDDRSPAGGGTTLVLPSPSLDENEGVLGGTGGPTDTPTASPGTPSPTPSATPEEIADPAGDVTPAPALPDPPAPPPGTPAPPAPQPTTQPPTPTSAPHAPTPTPTPAPTPTPTPTADVTCTNGVDDDGDLLIDGADPGCILGSSEFDA